MSYIKIKKNGAQIKSSLNFLHVSDCLCRVFKLISARVEVLISPNFSKWLLIYLTSLSWSAFFSLSDAV